MIHCFNRACDGNTGSDHCRWIKSVVEGCKARIIPPSESEQIPKPSAREAEGDRVERLDGLHASEASGPASAIQPGGAGKATEGSAAGEALRDERSQLPDGLPNRGGDLSERELMAAERTLGIISEALAQECNGNMEHWGRDTMEKHARQRAAVIDVRAMLLDMADISSASVKPIKPNEARR